MLYAMLGHNGPPTNYWRENLITGEELRRCPVRDLLDARARDPRMVDEVDRYVEFYLPAYRDGHLLVAGGVADQPARYLAMIGELLRLNAAAEAKYDQLQELQREGS